MEEKQMQRAHKLVIIGRKTGTVSGISDVLSFDENEIVLDLEGKVDSMVYSERGHKKKQEGSLISRLLR